ncbi:hypothetical protein VTN77DRAFT_4353 [Rasamsonia byssochlamydoides]|uniref:uncharacterized protein n=1 Tax=Rasamsonia byssochlamydoides TaxID=89139 RepID=UPI003744B108
MGGIVPDDHSWTYLMVEAKRIQDGAVDTLNAFFQANPSVDFVRLQWANYSGVVHLS